MNIDVFDVTLALLGVALILALFRMARGPTLPDRILSLELTSMLTVGIILVHVVQGSTYLLDVAIVLALVSFMGTVTFAYYLERGPRP